MGKFGSLFTKRVRIGVRCRHRDVSVSLRFSDMLIFILAVMQYYFTQTPMLMRASGHAKLVVCSSFALYNNCLNSCCSIFVPLANTSITIDSIILSDLSTHRRAICIKHDVLTCKNLFSVA